MKIHGNTKLNIIEPSCHGNGGWIGSRVIGRARFSEIVRMNPYHEMDLSYSPDNAYFFGDIAPRACFGEGINEAVMVWDLNDYRWLWDETGEPVY